MATVKKAGEEPDRFEDVDFLKRFYKRYNKCYVLVGSMYYLYLDGKIKATLPIAAVQNGNPVEIFFLQVMQPVNEVSRASCRCKDQACRWRRPHEWQEGCLRMAIRRTRDLLKNMITITRISAASITYPVYKDKDVVNVAKQQKIAMETVTQPTAGKAADSGPASIARPSAAPRASAAAAATGYVGGGHHAQGEDPVDAFVRYTSHKFFYKDEDDNAPADPRLDKLDQEADKLVEADPEKDVVEIAAPITPSPGEVVINGLNGRSETVKYRALTRGDTSYITSGGPKIDKLTAVLVIILALLVGQYMLARSPKDKTLEKIKGAVLRLESQTKSFSPPSVPETPTWHTWPTFSAQPCVNTQVTPCLQSNTEAFKALVANVNTDLETSRKHAEDMKKALASARDSRESAKAMMLKVRDQADKLANRTETLRAAKQLHEENAEMFGMKKKGATIYAVVLSTAAKIKAKIDELEASTTTLSRQVNETVASLEASEASAKARLQEEPALAEEVAEALLELRRLVQSAKDSLAASIKEEKVKVADLEEGLKGHLAKYGASLHVTEAKVIRAKLEDAKRALQFFQDEDKAVDSLWQMVRTVPGASKGLASKVLTAYELRLR